MKSLELKMKKLELCSMLASMSKKEVQKSLTKIATELGLKPSQARYAWKNFTKEGDPDIKFKDGKYVGICSKNIKKWQQKNKAVIFSPKRNLRYKTKINILRDYFFDTDLKTIDILDKYNIGRKQFYDILGTLQIEGKVGRKTILTWSEHPKVDIKDIRRFNKEKIFESKTDMVYYTYVKHVNKILFDYLK